MDKRRGALVVAVVVLIGLVAAVVWFGVLQPDEEPTRPGVKEGDPATEAADAFAAAWQGGTLSDVRFVDTNGDVNARTLATTTGLGPGVGDKPAKVETERPAKPERDAERRSDSELQPLRRRADSRAHDRRAGLGRAKAQDRRRRATRPEAEAPRPMRGEPWATTPASPRELQKRAAPRAAA